MTEFHAMAGSAAADGFASHGGAEDGIGRRGARRVLVCAWCRTLLHPQPRRGDEVENFGICRRCLQEQLSRCQDLPIS